MRARLVSLVAILAGLALLGPAPAHAGFLYDVFGIGEPDPPQAPALAPVRRAREHGPASKPGAGRRASSQTSTKHAPDARQTSLAEILKANGAKAAFVQDPTLRRGDVVVTEGGIDVFEGRAGESHDAMDFKPVAKSSLRDRATLLELERVSLLRRGDAPFAVAAPADVPLTVSVSPRKRRAKVGAAEGEALVRQP